MKGGGTLKAGGVTKSPRTLMLPLPLPGLDSPRSFAPVKWRLAVGTVVVVVMAIAVVVVLLVGPVEVVLEAGPVVVVVVEVVGQLASMSLGTSTASA